MRIVGYVMHERRGLALAQAEKVAGINELTRALRRCAICAARSHCGRSAAYCPNGSLLLRAKAPAGGPHEPPVCALKPGN